MTYQPFYKPETESEVSRVTNLDTRETTPSYEVSAFIRCQIGRHGSTLMGHPTFELIAFGPTWRGAFDHWKRRQEERASYACL